MKIHTFRLKQGQDLKGGIQQYVEENSIQAGFIIACVGGLKKAVVRMPGATPDDQTIKTYNEKLEIVSLTGTVSINGCHLHISLSTKTGEVIGGHLKEGSLVALTAEIVLGEDEDKKYSREPDGDTGFDELVVRDI